MKAALALAVLLLQIASVSSNDPVAAPQYLRFERAVSIPANSTGQACASLDASVFAHAASESLNDLRLYTASATETPFNFSVSGTQSIEDDPATIHNLTSSDGNIVFDIDMPPRPYSAIMLDLSAKDFLGTAQVSSADGKTPLGTFAIFDLTAQHLSRSTTLPLQESTLPRLHVTLHLAPAHGVATPNLSPSIVHGATVPPSREAQTLYTPIASTSSITQRGRYTVATISIPAHVPAERVSFTLDPEFTKNFYRDVTITATPQGSRNNAAIETMSGAISHVKLPPTIESDQLSIDAALGANLRNPATVTLFIDNANNTPLPLTAVQLEMRQRKICFQTSSQASYRLMYGDPTLHAPAYDYAAHFTPSANPIPATLAAEQRNPTFIPRRDTHPYLESHPELPWVISLALLGILGSIALRRARTRHN
jgi:hypothetical protein